MREEEKKGTIESGKKRRKIVKENENSDAEAEGEVARRSKTEM